MRKWCTGIGAMSVGVACSTASAQTSVNVDMTGVSISSLSTAPADVVRSSAPNTINAATGYLYTFNPILPTTGIFGSVVPTTTPLGDVLNTFVPGQYKVVRGAMRHPAGTVPTAVYQQAVGGTFSGLTLNLTLVLDILAD